MDDRSAAGEGGAETEASVEPPGADCIPRDEGPPRPDGTRRFIAHRHAAFCLKLYLTVQDKKDNVPQKACIEGAQNRHAAFCLKLCLTVRDGNGDGGFIDVAGV